MGVEAAANGAAALELKGLRRSFGDVVALDGLTFSVEPGALFGFVGRNGAGKTTTMRIVCGLLAADEGSVRWRGAATDARFRERVGYMPEERGLYPKMRVRDQLAAALVHQPELLVLDEPFAGLDPIVCDLLTEVLREQATRGVPVLFSSHQLDL